MYYTEIKRVGPSISAIILTCVISLAVLVCICSCLFCGLSGMVTDESPDSRSVPTSRPTAKPTPRFYYNSFTTSAWKLSEECEWEGVTYGMHSGQVLQLHPADEWTENLKLLSERQRLVAFYYEDAIIVFKAQSVEGATVDDDLALFVEEIYVRR